MQGRASRIVALFGLLRVLWLSRDIRTAQWRLICCVQGKRAALPSATIMLRQPIQRFQQMQASDIDIYRNELRKTNAEIVRTTSTAWWPANSLTSISA